MQQAKAGLGGDGDQTVEVLSIMGLTTPFSKRNKRGPSPGTPETSQLHFFLLTMMFFFFFVVGPGPRQRLLGAPARHRRTLAGDGHNDVFLKLVYIGA